jgi:hypothetical protein
MKQHEVGWLCLYLIHAGFLLDLFFEPEDGVEHVLPKRLLTFSGQRGVVFQKMKLIITAAVRTSGHLLIE